MRHLSIMALVAAAVILPAGQSYQSTRAGPEVPFYVITKAETPVVTIGPAEPKKYLAIFISPTCNFCNKLYLDIVKAMKSRDPRFRDVEVTFALMPRKDADFRIIKELMCVGERNFADAVHLYNEEIFSQTRGWRVSDNVALDASKKIMARFDVTDAKREKCVASQRYETVISLITLIGDRIRERNEVPIVVYRNEPRNADEFYGVRALLE